MGQISSNFPKDWTVILLVRAERIIDYRLITIEIIDTVGQR